MQWLLGFAFKYRNLLSLTVALSVSGWMVSMPPGQKVRMADTFSTTVFYPVQYAVQQTQKIRNLWRENIRLRDEVARLSSNNAFLEEKVGENERLRKLLDFKEKTDFDLIPCEVIGRNPERDNYSFVLNAGSGDGVALNMPVVGISGVVGKITAVSGFSSRVQLLADPNCGLGAMVRRSRVASVLESEGGRRFKMRVQEYADVQEGDEVTTSGMGGIFPKGLKVGRVRSTRMDRFNTFKEVYVDLCVDFDYVEEVFIMKKAAVWRADTTNAVSLE